MRQEEKGPFSASQLQLPRNRHVHGIADLGRFGDSLFALGLAVHDFRNRVALARDRAWDQLARPARIETSSARRGRATRRA